MKITDLKSQVKNAKNPLFCEKKRFLSTSDVEIGYFGSIV